MTADCCYSITEKELENERGARQGNLGFLFIQEIIGDRDEFTIQMIEWGKAK